MRILLKYKSQDGPCIYTVNYKLHPYKPACTLRPHFIDLFVIPRLTKNNAKPVSHRAPLCETAFFYFNGLFFIVFFRFCPEYYAAVFMPFVLSGFYVVHLLLLLKSSVDNSKLVSSLNKWQFLLHLY